MNLTAIVFATLLSLIRPSTYWAPGSLDSIEVIADDIVLASRLLDGVPFTGPHRVERHALALALAAIAVHESNLAERVVSCAYAGDPLRGQAPGQGRSVTAFQLMKGVAWGGHSRAEICGSGPLAAYLAGRVLTNHRRASTVLGLFQGYASGDMSRRSNASARQCRMWAKAMRDAGFPGHCQEKP